MPTWILITGVTGFLGKVVLEEVLRQYEDVKVFVLVRARDGCSADQRFQTHVASSLCFSLLPPNWTDRVEVVAGDLTQVGCGLDAIARAKLVHSVTRIIHCAGSVSFDARMSDAATNNITTVLNLLELAKHCLGLERVVVASTAYVTPYTAEPVFEDRVPLPRPAGVLYQEMQKSTVPDRDLLRETGHPNTYTLSKCVAEHLLLDQHDGAPLSIMRPSVIGASWRYPFPGWVDSYGAAAGFVASYGTGLYRVFRVDPDAVLDIVPVDQVANRMIQEAFECPGQQGSRILLVVSSLTNGCSHNARITLALADFFHHNGNVLYQKPCLGYLGLGGVRFAAQNFRYHTLPFWVASLYFTVIQDRRRVRLLQKVSTLNSQFEYFTHHTYDFRPSVSLPDVHDSDHHWEIMCGGVQRYLLQSDPRQTCFGGQAHRPIQSGISRWFRTSTASLVFRISGFMVQKLLRLLFDTVTVDTHSFACALTHGDPKTPLVIAPSHRSYLDPLVLTFLFHTKPSLRIPTPRIAAAHEFTQLPGCRWLLPRLGAFFIQRGQGHTDPDLANGIKDIVDARQSLMFFPEGMRSRSRQVLPVKHGMLRCLQSTESSSPVTVLPVAISYDRVPEEGSLAAELRGEPKQPMRLGSLLPWVVTKLLLGRVKLGRVHVRCGRALQLEPDLDIDLFGRVLMAELRANTATTTFHLACFVEQHASSVGIDPLWLRTEIERRGGVVVDSGKSVLGVAGVDPVVRSTFLSTWMHLFFRDMLSYQPSNAAIAHFAAECQPELSLNPVDHDCVDLDARTLLLLKLLFQPVCDEYVRVIEEVKRLLCQGAVSFTAPQLWSSSTDCVASRAAVKYLEAQGHIALVDGSRHVYMISCKTGELEALLLDCQWRELDLSPCV